MAQITLLSAESEATKYIPHTEELFQKYQEALAKFPDLEDNCSISYYEADPDEEEPGIHVWWANEKYAVPSDWQIYFASPIDISSEETASLEELKCLHELIGDFWFSVSGCSSHGDDFDSGVTAIDGKVTWGGDWS